MGRISANGQSNGYSYGGLYGTLPAGGAGGSVIINNY